MMSFYEDIKASVNFKIEQLLKIKSKKCIDDQLQYV